MFYKGSLWLRDGEKKKNKKAMREDSDYNQWDQILGQYWILENIVGILN